MFYKTFFNQYHFLILLSPSVNLTKNLFRHVSPQFPIFTNFQFKAGYGSQFKFAGRGLVFFSPKGKSLFLLIIILNNVNINIDLINKLAIIIFKKANDNWLKKIKWY